MRAMAAVVGIVAALATPALAADRRADRVDAQMLLDLDLLSQGDPARHRDQGVAEELGVLEMLRRLESPADAAPARRRSAPPPPATPAPADGATR